MHSASIEGWLSQVLQNQTPKPNQTLKRPRHVYAARMTPPLSRRGEDGEASCHNLEATPTKRQRLGNTDETPRGPRVLRAPKSSSASSAHMSSQSSQVSHTSQKSSPRKRLASMALQDDAIKTKLILKDSKPPELSSFVKEFVNIDAGIDVIPAALQVQFLPSWTLTELTFMLQESIMMETANDVIVLTPQNFAPPTQVEELLPFPDLVDLLGIVDYATKCEREAAAEATWNMAVHYPLLRLAVQGGSRHRRRTVDFVPCTTADITREYLPVGQSGKRVDFALHLEPDADDAERIDRLRRSLPLLSINHTGYEALEARPITASIETKRHASPDEAVLQLALWQASQWNSLSSILAHVHRAAPPDHVPTADEAITPDPAAVAARSRTATARLARLPFLPGVVVQGHEWSLVATTRTGHQTVRIPPPSNLNSNATH
ncbi:hypothetical protein AK830_g12005 [Neonectria ditissima]|uniref:PD-(D/E)XK nuclease-like domain-containing protein n=1 Tax=Neonectria ditissima TaxID=78410 RepID=A0A0P7B1K3_9HYPO|nr:hypothetical protein AK830_g12005 [Neonectria ditissima]